MPGWNWRFKNKPPLSFKILVVCVIVNLAAQMSLIFTLPKWGRYLPDTAHSFPLSVKGRGLYFVHPWAGRYLSQGLWINFVLIAAIIFILWRNRAAMERTA